MRNAITYLLFFLGGFLLFPSVSTGQEINLASGTTPDGQFARIDASLAEAADLVLESTAHERLTPKASLLEQQVQVIAPNVAFQDTSERRTSRTDAFKPFVQPILRKEGVPDQLAAVIVVESGGNPLALSPKGARGLWQLMPETARRYGLRVDERLDERLDIEKATTSAARYLRDLYSQFGSWQLALAAYNTGELNLERAIARARSRDFMTLSTLGYLPAETRNYVPAVMTAMGRLSPSVFVPTQSSRAPKLVYAIAEDSGQ